jgi:hypothetical protein
MHRITIYWIIFYLFLAGLNLSAQNIFVLERPGTIKNYKFYSGDKIKIRTISNDTVISGLISLIYDNSIIIDNKNEIMTGNIAAIYRNRWGYSFLQYLSLFAGIAYVSINTLNGLINSDTPIVPTETLIISGSMIAFGIALSPLTTRKYKIDNQKWRVLILDFTD